MKVIYTLINSETNDCYTGQTNSLATRISQHIANGLFWILQLPVTVPIRVLLNTWKLILRVFISKDPDGDEHRVIQETKDEWYNVINKKP